MRNELAGGRQRRKEEVEEEGSLLGRWLLWESGGLVGMQRRRGKSGRGIEGASTRSGQRVRPSMGGHQDQQDRLRRRRLRQRARRRCCRASRRLLRRLSSRRRLPRSSPLSWRPLSSRRYPIYQTRPRRPMHSFHKIRPHQRHPTDPRRSTRPPRFTRRTPSRLRLEHTSRLLRHQPRRDLAHPQLHSFSPPHVGRPRPCQRRAH